MRVIKCEDKEPFVVCAGDTVVAQVKQDGEVIASTTSVITKSRIVDRIAIVEAEDSELEQLGMVDAIGAFFGKRQ